MDDLTERLAEALAVCEGATEGPWEFEPDRTMRDGVYPAYVFAEHMAGYPICDVTSTHIPAGDEDAEFIAHARTGYPAALRALQAVLELHWPAKFTDDTETGYEVGSDGDPCMECNLADREGLTPMVWPCPTVRAITEHLGATP